MNSDWVVKLKLRLLLTTFLLISTPLEAQTKPSVGLSGALQGVVRPVFDSEVATSETGIINKIFVKPGDRVVKGQPLASLESSQILAALAIAEAEANAKGTIEAAKQDVRLKTLVRDRTLTIFEKGNATPLEKERTEIEMEISLSRLATEEERQLSLRLQFERQRQQLADRTILAPANGIVTQVFKQVGEHVAANSPTIVQIVDITQLRAEIFVGETDLLALKQDDSVRVKMSNGRIITGKISFVPPLAEDQSGWFRIEVLLDNQDESINSSHCTLLTK